MIFSYSQWYYQFLLLFVNDIRTECSLFFTLGGVIKFFSPVLTSPFFMSQSSNSYCTLITSSAYAISLSISSWIFCFIEDSFYIWNKRRLRYIPMSLVTNQMAKDSRLKKKFCSWSPYCFFMLESSFWTYYFWVDVFSLSMYFVNILNKSTITLSMLVKELDLK